MNPLVPILCLVVLSSAFEANGNGLLGDVTMFSGSEKGLVEKKIPASVPSLDNLERQPGEKKVYFLTIPWYTGASGGYEESIKKFRNNMTMIGWNASVYKRRLETRPWCWIVGWKFVKLPTAPRKRIWFTIYVWILPHWPLSRILRVIRAFFLQFDYKIFFKLQKLGRFIYCIRIYIIC